VPSVRRRAEFVELAGRLLSGFLRDAELLAPEDRRVRLDEIADVVIGMPPSAQTSFCETHLQCSVVSDVIELGDALTLCKRMLVQGIDCAAVNPMVQSVLLHEKFRSAAPLPRELVMQAAVLVFVAGFQEGDSPSRLPPSCPGVLVAPVERLQELAMPQMRILAAQSPANVAPHWNVLAHLLAGDSMT